MKQIILLTAIITGCSTYDDTPPHLVDACIKHETTLEPVPAAAAPGMGIPLGSIRMVPRTKCVEMGKKCIWGKDWLGPQECKK